MQANMHEAKSKLSQLAERASQGEEVIIAKAGKPFVKLVPYTAAPKRQFGQFRGEFEMADDFDSPEVNDEITALFESGE
jgi:prevent-host-death family protein